MAQSAEIHHGTRRPAQIHLVVGDEKSTLRAEALGEAVAARKWEGRWFSHSNFQPTGRYVTRGQEVTITLQPFIAGIEVVIGQYGEYKDLNDGTSLSPMELPLHHGTNVITASIDGMLYIQNRTSEKAVVVEVHGGSPIPTYIKGVTDRNTFDAQIKKWNTAPFIELIGENVLANFQYTMAVPSLEATPINLDQRIDLLDKVVVHTNAFYGLSKNAIDFARKYPHRIYIANPDTGGGYASATESRITFQIDSGAGRHLLVSREDDQFGYYHEVGHTYQMDEIRWSGLIEVTVNLAALYVWKRWVNRIISTKKKHTNQSLLFVKFRLPNEITQLSTEDESYICSTNFAAVSAIIFMRSLPKEFAWKMQWASLNQQTPMPYSNTSYLPPRALATEI